MIKESVKMSWSNIINNKMRSFLTTLGIIIGVASIIALITIVEGVISEVTNEITSLGANTITVKAAGTPLKRGLNNSDLEKLNNIENIQGIAPSISGTTAVSANKILEEKISIIGTNQYFFYGEVDIIKAGREINTIDVENSSKVAVIGSDIVNELFFGENPIGKDIVINGITFKIIGLLNDSSEFAMNSNNNSVIIPYTTAMKISNNHNVMSVEVIKDNEADADKIVDDINAILNTAFNYKENAFKVFNMEEMIDVIGEITGIMSLMLAGIASISLLVGGIGIMNMMLVSVTERTTEIGLRKALGAEPMIIQLQFIIEAIFLSLFGGIIGLLIGIFAAYFASILIGFSVVISMSTILLAIGFSGGVGIIFGLMPARKASRLNPIDALRHV